MSEMVDRVALAIGAKFPDWSAMARAAIEAMREPTTKMLYEGNRSTTDGRGAEDSWPAMIDEALKDG
jgi:hypothetical protein